MHLPSQWAAAPRPGACRVARKATLYPAARGRRRLTSRPAAAANDFLGQADADPVSTTTPLPGRSLVGPANVTLDLVAQTLALPPWPAVVGAEKRQQQKEKILPPFLSSSFSSSSSSEEEEEEEKTTLTLVLPADVDAVMDAYLEAGAGDADPYWARPWPAGLALASALAAQPGLVAGKCVLDVGAGAGVAGLAAAAAGAGAVCLTDRDPWALECAAASAAATLGEATAGAVVSTRRLDWSDEGEVAAATAASTSGAGWEVVLATDVLYDASAAEPVAAALGALLAPGGLALVADPARRAPAHRAAFAEALAALRPPLVLESWTAVSGSGELAVPDAPGTTLVLFLRSRVGGRGTIGAPGWP